jgi:predicted hydrocarbon binding protein/KaiC/GvpD/RAD55 family RecA-like ATPase
MEKRGLAIAEIQEVPKGNLILLTGSPGAGKSTFCYQTVLNGLTLDKPVIFVTTEHGPSEVMNLLRERGAGEPLPSAINFIDAFGETVGASNPERTDTVTANCEDLNSISMAIAKLQERIGRHDALLAFDSLTSPYLFNREEVFRFMRLCLAKFASEGNSVLALMDEGCGKEEDLGAMMSVADGIIKMEIRESSRTLNVVKHPKVRPARIEVPIESERVGLKARIIDPGVLRGFFRARIAGETVIRKEVGDFVNLFWPNLAHWSGMLWEPKRFPMMTYELNKEDGVMIRDIIPFFPWRWKLLLKLFLPKSFSKVKDVEKMWKLMEGRQPNERTGTIEYLEDISKTDEHYFRLYESSDCWGFENVGTAMASYIPPTAIAGLIKGFESWRGLERDWNTIETKCIGIGDPYCEFKLVPGEIGELRSSLEKDASTVERIHERLIERLMGFLLDEKPLVERPRLGSDIHIHVVFHVMAFPALAGERYRMALRMGGAKSGKEVGERMMESGLKEDETIKRVVDFMNYCKVGKVTMDETIRIKENCEGSQTKAWTTKIKEPSCFFTTGFLNGLFSAVKRQHVREVKCIVAGDPYCEWEIL